MKYVVVLYDGMADYPVPALGGKTPMMVANKPNFDRLAQRGEVGLVRTVAEGLKPGSDVANLSVMGYDPKKYYTGRSPLEAVSIGVKMADDDIALRCNVVTLSDEPNYEDKTMIDYSAGDISSAEAAEIIKTVQEHFGGGEFDFIFNPKLFDGVNDHEDNRKNKKAPASAEAGKHRALCKRSRNASAAALKAGGAGGNGGNIEGERQRSGKADST